MNSMVRIKSFFGPLLRRPFVRYLAIGQGHDPGGGIDADHFAHLHGDIALAAKDVPQRRGDRRRREARGGHLVKQGLEKMIIAAIDQRDFDRRPLELANRPQSCESAADDHDSLGFCHRRKT